MCFHQLRGPLCFSCIWAFESLEDRQISFLEGMFFFFLFFFWVRCIWLWFIELYFFLIFSLAVCFVPGFLFFCYIGLCFMILLLYDGFVSTLLVIGLSSGSCYEFFFFFWTAFVSVWWWLLNQMGGSELIYIYFVLLVPVLFMLLTIIFFVLLVPVPFVSLICCPFPFSCGYYTLLICSLVEDFWKPS